MSDVDPTGKRALFTSRVDEDLQADGKEALFSQRDRTPGRIAVDCSKCGATTHVDAADALLRILSFSVWIPGRSYSRRLRCPACHHRTWVRLRIT
jgi:hypothetical protein